MHWRALYRKLGVHTRADVARATALERLPKQRIAADGVHRRLIGAGYGCGRACRKCLHETLMLNCESSVVAVINGDEDAMRRAAEDQRDDQAVGGLQSEMAQAALVKPRWVELVAQALCPV